MNKLLSRKIGDLVRRLLKQLGWDLVRYHPKSEIWPSLLGAGILPIRTVLDIGAKDGDTARIFRRYYPQAVIHCFEPHPVSFRSLETWANEQGGTVHCYPFALGDTTGLAQIHTIGSKLAIASLHPPGAWQFADPQFKTDYVVLPVQVNRLDDLSDMLYITDDLLVKIDTEGFEKKVIQGGKGVLSRASAIIVEIHSLKRYAGQPSFVEIVELMAGFHLEFAGIIYQGRGKNGKIIYVDALFIKEGLI